MIALWLNVIGGLIILLILGVTLDVIMTEGWRQVKVSGVLLGVSAGLLFFALARLASAFDWP